MADRTVGGKLKVKANAFPRISDFLNGTFRFEISQRMRLFYDDDFSRQLLGVLMSSMSL